MGETLTLPVYIYTDRASGPPLRRGIHSRPFLFVRKFEKIRELLYNYYIRIKKVRDCSSMAEQSAVNRCAVGSSPTSPANRDDRREIFSIVQTT